MQERDNHEPLPEETIEALRKLGDALDGAHRRLEKEKVIEIVDGRVIHEDQEQ